VTLTLCADSRTQQAGDEGHSSWSVLHSQGTHEALHWQRAGAVAVSTN
jgi:hypothetical protein